MTALTEGKHTGGFIAAELPHDLSRDTATLTSGQVVVDGTVVMDPGTGKLVAAEGSGTSGQLDGTVKGIIIGNWDATAGDILKVPYISNNAFYKATEVTFPTEDTEEASGTTTLAALKIRPL